MSSDILRLIAPLDTQGPAPVLGEDDVLTPAQWTTLLAIADALVPSIVSTATEKSGAGGAKKDTLQEEQQCLVVDEAEYETARRQIETVARSAAVPSDKPTQTDSALPTTFLAERASSVPAFRTLLHRTLSDWVRDDARRGLRVALWVLSTRLGSLLLTGSTTPLAQQSVASRGAAVRAWMRCWYLRPVRALAKALSILVLATWTRTSMSLNQVVGFERAPVHGRPSKGFEYDFLQFPPDTKNETTRQKGQGHQEHTEDAPVEIDTDVVIVGSGCGGAVCAKNLAESGQRVLVCEQAYHWSAAHMPMSQAEAGAHLFANGGLLTTDDADLSVLAGEAFGGGGTVNWSASLHTQDYVRHEWAREHGLDIFTSATYQASLDRVCARMGASTHNITHNTNNAMLSEGAKKLGFSVHDVPQNTGGKQHYCGYCTLGCGAAEKQGPMVSFLPDAARAGAKFIEGFSVERVLFDTVIADGKEKGKVAVGVEGTWRSRDAQGDVSDAATRTTRKVLVRAKRVIVAGGTLYSPLLLLRSGLTNAHIGRNLHMHPAAVLLAVHSDRPAFRPWEGGILTSVCDEFQNLDGKGHGVKLECVTMLPGWIMPFLTWRGGLAYKQLITKMPWMTGFISLARDRDTGRVYPDPVEPKQPRMAYTVSDFDKRHIVEGLVAAAKIAYVEGATELHIPHFDVEPFLRRGSTTMESKETPNINEPAFQAWLAHVRQQGLPPVAALMGNAHQMGTCRMSTSPRNGVVDSKGKVHEVAEGLYVADASTFPSASGVNPMVTCMAIADGISRGIAEDLARAKDA